MTKRLIASRKILNKKKASLQSKRKNSIILDPVKRTSDTKNNFSFWKESYINFLFGIIFIIITILFIGSLIKVRHTKEVTSISTKINLPSLTPTPSLYIVQERDDLWTIAEKAYNNGYNWVIIAKANNLVNPGTIYKGDKLIIPNINKKNDQVFISNTFPDQKPQNSSEQENTSEAITGTEYIVKHGDNLWDIALRAYADGYKWVDIAQANNLANPGLIHAGNVFIIPR